MGCSESKEAHVASPPAVAPKAKSVAAKPPGTPTTTSNDSIHKTHATEASPGVVNVPAKHQKEIEGKPMVSTVKMVTLNDVVPSSQSGGDDQRGRFLSYASGASTPNTSSGNLSWTGEGSSEGKDGGETKSGETITTSSKSGSIVKPKNKMYKHKHSGSAIDLENMLNDQNITSLTSKVVHIEVPFGRPIEEVYDGVHNGPILGSGVSGIVRKVTHKKTGVEYAVKSLDLGLVETKEGLEQLREEIFIMCQLDHPNIVRLEEVYESHSEIYLVQELCLGGELFDRLDEQPDYHYTEAECARLIKQMLCAVRYLHSKGIIHRDLKLENFLFSSTAQDSELKMIDFGLSKHFRYGEVHHEAVGTPYTVAPEVIRGQYDERCDIWAIGVIAFLLFSGDPPFGGCGGPEPLMVVRQNILDGDFEFEPAEIWDLVSDMGKSFVKDLLVTDPKQRPTAREAQKHAWLKIQASRGCEGNRQDNVLNPNVIKALVGFKEFSVMRKLLSEVLSFTLLPDQIKDLRKEFEIVDTDGTGEISLDNLKKVLVTNAEAGSLGALTEEEVVDIFNAMRVNKAETTIHWHEFIAAGLSQCHVDDRNLRLAFDRLDSDHKGYITLNDIVNLVGSDDAANQKEMREMWTESMEHVGSNQDHITYDHFLLIMKGQTEKAVLKHHIDLELRPRLLEAVPEQEEDTATLSMSSNDPKCETTIETTNTAPTEEVMVSNDQKETRASIETVSSTGDESHFLSSSPISGSLPNMEAKCMYDSSGSLSVRDISDSSSGSASNKNATWPSPKTPKNVCDKQDAVPKEHLSLVTKPPSPISRRRSQSLGNEPSPNIRQDSDMSNNDTDASSNQAHNARSEKVALGVDTRRAINLPERHDANQDELAKKSAIAVNRELYRAHRYMRISVLEASRRFEEKQAIRARDTLMKEQMKKAMGAGLVMRHGTKLHVTTEAIRDYLDQAAAEQRAQIEKANRKGGRGRRTRKKTISDMSAMLSPSMGQDELGQIAVAAWSQTPDSKRSVQHYNFEGVEGLPDLSVNGAGLSPGSVTSTLAPRTKACGDNSRRRNSGSRIMENLATPPPTSGEDPSTAIPNLPQVGHKSLRKATVPGRFLKTEDPFSASGMYGAE